MKEAIVLYPAPSFPHLVSIVELGKLIHHHHQSHFSIIILVPSMPNSSLSTTTSSYINHQTNSESISFLSLPPLQQPNITPFDSIPINALTVVETLKTLSSSFTLLALITSNLHQNLKKTHIPIYFYFTSCASSLAFFLYLPTFHTQTTQSFKDLTQDQNPFLKFPGLPLLSASFMPEPVMNRDTPSYNFFLSFASCLLETKGLIVNTFDLLEPSAIEAIRDGTCVPNDQTPPIFCIGPLISTAKDYANAKAKANEACDCLAWLDQQPSQSVVFLCFGSKGVFCEVQIKEIAMGLERSSHRFLWVVKSPLGLDTEPILEDLLPHGFLERTKEKGLVLKSWAPQNAILSHESVGGFVTHCGWNSVLEAVRYGVPMVAWPLYAEQHMNSVVMVKEMKVAMSIFGEEKSSKMVSAEEVERRVRALMEFEEGKVVRKRCLEVKEMAMAAWSKGGSSFNAFTHLVCSWKHG
ncbi:UDP-glycosyltransferase 88B1 [Senna tora]|uniref:Glycosyltransferase n=1 Tax=Senna tora TaxID=362788 RepID=A0A834X9H9_9FABA|nr:UDP-glycosyltransferase 88B1 [Senna tora]